jgi:hypothetical protein
VRAGATARLFMTMILSARRRLVDLLIAFFQTLWFKTGTNVLIVNSNNEPLTCSDCPCETNCCSSLPSTLHITISGSGSCGIDGTYPITFGANGWTGLTSNNWNIDFECGLSTTPSSCGMSLLVGPPTSGVGYAVINCGNSSGTWESTACSPPNFTSNPTYQNPDTDGCGAATFQVTS